MGTTVLRALRLGMLLVAFRNRGNNCTLAFWAGDPGSVVSAKKSNE